MTKQFKIQPEAIKPLVENKGGCIATDRITVEGYPVNFMYREQPMNPQDTGWRFFSGMGEDDAYLADPSHSGVYSVNTICNYDQTIIPFIDAPVGSVFERDRTGQLVAVTDFEIPG